MNDIARMISRLEQQRASIDRAISALRDVEGSGAAVVAAAASAAAPAATAPSSAGAKRGPKPGKKRRLSAEGRAKIIAATKARWARIRAEQAKGKK